MSPHRHFHRIAWAAIALAACVIVFGAFVRLSDAGLGCPDWPTCYGKATWPMKEATIAAANERFERPVEVTKAWREQFHRHIAALLGLMVLSLAALAARRRRFGLLTVFGASGLVALAIPLYMQAHYVASSVLVAIAQLWLWGFAFRSRQPDFSRLASITLAVIIIQAMLGMWTVTWLLKPVVVMAHLMGGLTTFSLILWLAWRSTPNAAIARPDAARLRLGLIVGTVLLGIQIALGGWTSANYAALACGTDFPTCLGEWWPETDFREGFVLWRGIGVDYEGGLLDGPARAAIQMAHRLMAIVVVGHLLALSIKLIRATGLRAWGAWLMVALAAQVALGISNVVFGLPLPVATLHQAGALVLLFILMSLLARLRPA